MKKILSWISFGLGIFLLWLWVSAFTDLLRPHMVLSDNPIDVFMGATIMFLPTGLLFRYLSLLSKSAGRIYYLLRDICYLVAYESSSIVFMLINSAGLATYPIPRLIIFILSLFGSYKLHYKTKQLDADIISERS